MGAKDQPKVRFRAYSPADAGPASSLATLASSLRSRTQGSLPFGVLRLLGVSVGGWAGSAYSADLHKNPGGIRGCRDVPS